MPKRGRSRARARYQYLNPQPLRARAISVRASSKKRKTLSSQVGRLLKTIETKEAQWKTGNNIGLAHNNVTVVLSPGGGGYLNCLQSNQGFLDQDMVGNGGQRIGDEITIQSVKFHGMVEGALQRSKVYFRFMLVKCAKGDLPTRATLFKGNADNKMIDEINTERFSIVASKIFNVSPPNPPPNTVSLTGVAEPGVLAGVTGNRIFKITIPGRKFGRQGVIKYENALTSQVKYFDYVPIFVAYDWYGTPQDVNTVGRINEMYVKTRFKDA